MILNDLNREIKDDNNKFIHLRSNRIVQMGQEEEVDYKQELGLKKILYKYDNENQQLRAQIKALNQRLQSILQKQSQSPQHLKKPSNPIQQYQGKLLKQQLQKLYKQVNHQSTQMKINKDSIDQRHQQKCKELENMIVKEEKELKELRYKLGKYEALNEELRLGESNKDKFINSSGNHITPSTPTTSLIDKSLLTSNNRTLRSSSTRLQTYLTKLSLIDQQTQLTRKSIRQLEHQRDSNQRQLLKKHQLQTNVKIQNKLLEGKQIREESPINNVIGIKKKGIWAMENTKQNYEFIRSQLQKLKQQKSTTLQMIKNENIVLSNKLNQLQSQLNQLNNTIDIPPIPYQKRPIKLPTDLYMSKLLQSPVLMMRKSLKPIELDYGQNEYKRKIDDKNFVGKMTRKVQWQSTKNTNSAIQWNDMQCKSPITGINFWFDGYLLGVQIIHEKGNSGQQLQILNGKRLAPAQYRLPPGDHLQNAILYISEGFIHGVELLSKNGRVDKFGNLLQKARRFDFGLKKPQKPIVSFGQYRITNNVSEITKLGFEVI